jgi:hypothetical protein
MIWSLKPWPAFLINLDDIPLLLALPPIFGGILDFFGGDGVDFQEIVFAAFTPLLPGIRQHFAFYFFSSFCLRFVQSLVRNPIFQKILTQVV